MLGLEQKKDACTSGNRKSKAGWGAWPRLQRQFMAVHRHCAGTADDRCSAGKNLNWLGQGTKKGLCKHTTSFYDVCSQPLLQTAPSVFMVRAGMLPVGLLQSAMPVRDSCWSLRIHTWPAIPLVLSALCLRSQQQQCGCRSRISTGIDFDASISGK